MTLSTAATSCFADTCCSLLPRTQDQGFPVSLPSFPFYGIIILLFKSINKAIAIAIAGRNVQDLLWNHVFLDLLESILQLWFCFQLSAKNRKCRPIFNIQCHRYFHPNQQLHCNALPYRGLQMFFRFRNFQFSPWPEELKLVRCVKGRHGYWICVTMPTPTNTTHQRAKVQLCFGQFSGRIKQTRHGKGLFEPCPPGPVKLYDRQTKKKESNKREDFRNFWGTPIL